MEPDTVIASVELGVLDYKCVIVVWQCLAANPEYTHRKTTHNNNLENGYEHFCIITPPFNLLPSLPQTDKQGIICPDHTNPSSNTFAV